MGKRSTYLRELRDAALFDAYTKAVGEQDFSNQAEAYDYVRKHAAPRFFASAQFCESMVKKMDRGEPTGLRNPQAKRKYAELYRRYRKMLEERPELSVREICSIIVDQPAPEFYLNRRITQWIVVRERKRRWERTNRFLMQG